MGSSLASIFSDPAEERKNNLNTQISTFTHATHLICGLRATLGIPIRLCAVGTITLVVNGRQGASLAELRRCGGGDGEPWGDGEARGGQTCGDVAGREELVGYHLGDGRPLGGIGVQHPLDECSCRRGWCAAERKIQVLYTHYSFDGTVKTDCIHQSSSPRGWCSCSSWCGCRSPSDRTSRMGVYPPTECTWEKTHRGGGWLDWTTLRCCCSWGWFYFQTYNIHPSDQMSTS